MYYRIIETAAEHPDVLLYFEVDESGSSCVIINATGSIGEDKHQTAYESIIFENAESAIYFISDYSAKSANLFCAKHQMKY